MKASHEIRAIDSGSASSANPPASIARVALPDGKKVRAALDDEDAALATLTSLFEEGFVVEDH